MDVWFCYLKYINSNRKHNVESLLGLVVLVVVVVVVVEELVVIVVVIVVEV